MSINIAISSDRTFITCTCVTIASILHYHPNDIHDDQQMQALLEKVAEHHRKMLSSPTTTER